MSKYKISIEGYGAEITIGSVTEEEKAILNNDEKDLVEIVNEDLEEICGWSEIDDQFHGWGATDVFTITVEDEEGKVIYEIDNDDMYKHDTDEFELFDFECPEIDEEQELLMCVSSEKGTFFLGDIEVDGEFDITKLRITIASDIEVGENYFGEIITGVYYDGEEIDSYGGDTIGKSFDVYKNF